jgi:hypothetical protein
MSYVDVDASPEQLERVEEHLKLCSVCASEVAELRELIRGVAAPVGHAELDVSEHVASVLSRLDAPKPRARALRFPVWGGGLAAAAAIVLFFVVRGAGLGTASDHYAARGGPAPASLPRDIGVQLYAQEPALRSLASGSRIHAARALTAGLRNLGHERAFLLLFAVDAKKVVHWIAPAFTEVGSDPPSEAIVPTSSERLLPSAVVFDDLATGPLRVVAVITRKPEHVSSIERLEPSELDAEALLKRFPSAEVRQFLLEVVP